MRVWWGQEPLAPTIPSHSLFTSASLQEASRADLALAAALSQGSHPLTTTQPMFGRHSCPEEDNPWSWAAA